MRTACCYGEQPECCVAAHVAAVRCGSGCGSFISGGRPEWDVL